MVGPDDPGGDLCPSSREVTLKMSSRHTRRVLAGGLAAVAAVAATAAIIGLRERETRQAELRDFAQHTARLSFRLPVPFAGEKAVHGREATREARAGAAQEQYENRALPRETITFTQVSAATSAFRRAEGRQRARDLTPWTEIGPTVMDVVTEATQTGGLPTQWSGRITTLALGPNCTTTSCRLLVGAAGGGVWATDNAMAAHPTWVSSSAGLASNSIGSLTVDPNDPTGNTVYAGTGEESGSGDSEAGVGLYKSTDAGAHWTRVDSSVAVSKDRSIGAVAIEPGNPDHIYIGTAVARHGSSSANGGRFSPPGAPPVGLYESTDGGASFAPALINAQDVVDPTSAGGGDFFRGGVTNVQFDPNDRSRVFVAMFGYGLYRRAGNAAPELIYASQDPANAFAIRYEFALADLGAATRVYLGEGLDEVTDDNGVVTDGARLYRIDDATVPAASLTDGTANPGWTQLSDPTDGTPGYASFDFCQAQCSYDMFVASPASNPDEVWIGGSMQYGELPPYPGADRSNGRSVQRSTDGGRSFTDMTGDARTPFEDMHPDQHDIAFAGAVAFVGSDGGLIRTSGQYADSSAACDTRSLTGTDLADCRAWLASVPTLLTTINDGLATVQFQSLSADPRNPLGNLLGGTQDNGTLGFTGTPNWQSFISGDGGQSGFDARNSNIRYHMYFDAQGDVNFHGNNPQTWDWIFDGPAFSAENRSFYVPLIADPTVGGTAFVGLEHVWRTLDNGGRQEFLDNHCNVLGGPKGDKLFTGECGDWEPVGGDAGNLVTGPAADKGGSYVVAIERAPSNRRTMWVGTRRGRLFVSTNANAAAADVSYTRIDTPSQPRRFVSGISIDEHNPNHAIVSFSGYGAYTPTTPGHVFDVRFNPGNGRAIWTDISRDIGDQPVTDVALDADTGDIYASTDFGVLRLRRGAASWREAAAGLPPVAVYGLTIAPLRRGHVLYAATHGRGAFRVTLPAR